MSLACFPGLAKSSQSRPKKEVRFHDASVMPGDLNLLWVHICHIILTLYWSRLFNRWGDDLFAVAPHLSNGFSAFC